MAETVHADEGDRQPGEARPRRRPDADAFWRSGLTQAEAIRRERVERWREETQSPWEASPPGLVLWLLWRALYKGFQPLWLIGSLAAALWFGAQWLGNAGGVAAVSGPAPDTQAQLSAAIAASVPADRDPREFWTARLDRALDGDRRRRPDIDRFRSWVAVGPDLIGRDRLALEALAGPAGPDALDARLRAGPPWEREALLTRTFRARMAEGEARGLVPPELVFAPDAVRDRYERSQFHWSIANASARAFFRGRQRGEFEMRSLPGLVAEGRTGGHTRLYGGVRHLVIQACAHAPDAVEGCGAPIIPAERADALRYALAAIEAGLVRLPVTPSEAMAGAEVLQAGYRAGRLSPELEAVLSGRLGAVLAPASVTRGLTGTGVRADLAFAAPDQVRPSLSGRADLRGSDGAVALAGMLRDLAAIRAQTSPEIAVRLLDGLAAPEDVQRLRGLVEIAGSRTLAVRELMGQAAFDLAAPAGPASAVSDPLARRNTMLALVAAGLVVLLTLVRLATPRRIRLAARTNLADAWISRLTLGRKT
jgi:hypothetical protein